MSCLGDFPFIVARAAIWVELPLLRLHAVLLRLLAVLLRLLAVCREKGLKGSIFAKRHSFDADCFGESLQGRQGSIRFLVL